MQLHGIWTAPKEIPRLTDLEFVLKNGDRVMISWESGTFGKREFSASGVSTTNEDGRVTTGNLEFLRENIDFLDRIHYLSNSAPGTHVKEVTFVDQVKNRYKTQSWTFVNPNYVRLSKGVSSGVTKPTKPVRPARRTRI